MPLNILMLIGSLGLILLCCSTFVNAVERFAKNLGLHQGITGSILAAVSTALPETLIPIIAILFTRGVGGHDIGIGAIAGAPFMLGTLAFFVTGMAVIIFAGLKKRSTTMNTDISCLSRDLVFFLLFYGTAVATTLVHDYTIVKAVIALALLASYGIYLKQTYHSKVAEIDSVEELYAARFFGLPASMTWVIVQLVLSLLFMLVGAHFFIKGVQAISEVMNINPLILSLLITPFATELPEKFNSVIWISRKQDTLALGNVTGAMVFQSCFPVVFGMLFTPWHLEGVTLISAAFALLSATIVLIWVRVRRSISPYILLLGGVFYAIFVTYVAVKAFA